MFLSTLKKTIIPLLFLSVLKTVVGQNKDIDSQKDLIDSLQNVYYTKHSIEAFSVHHKNLIKSSNISYDKGILTAYKTLMWYHGVNEKASLDSVIYYANLFETKISSFNKQKDTILLKSIELPEYYLNKGQLLANAFGLPEQGLESYFKVYSLIPKNNKRLQIAYHISISEIYYQKLQYDRALNELNPMLLDTTGTSTSLKMRLLKNIAANYVKKEMPEKSYPLHKKVLDLAIEINDTEQIWWTKNKLAHDYFRLGEYQKAIDSALVVRNYCIKNNFHNLIFNNSVNLSTYYHAIGDLKQAITYREDALDMTSGLETKRDTYDRLAWYYTENKQYGDAIAIYEKKDSIVDSIRLSEKRALTNYIDSNVKLYKEKEKSQQILFDLELLEEKNKKQKLYFFSISIVLLSTILLLSSIILFRKYRKGEKVIETLKSNEKKLLEEKIAIRENELEASAMAVSQRLETLTSIKNELEEIKKPELKELDNIKSKISNLIKSTSDMSIITKRIESEYPTMTSKLTNKYPNLSETQIRYCLFTKLNLSIKETATILNVTPNTVKVARSRLKKKLNIPAEIPIKTFLDSFVQEEY